MTGYTRICPRCKCCVMRADDTCYVCDGPKGATQADTTAVKGGE